MEDVLSYLDCFGLRIMGAAGVPHGCDRIRPVHDWICLHHKGSDVNHDAVEPTVGYTEIPSSMSQIEADKTSTLMLMDACLYCNLALVKHIIHLFALEDNGQIVSYAFWSMVNRISLSKSAGAMEIAEFLLTLIDPDVRISLQ